MRVKMEWFVSNLKHSYLYIYNSSVSVYVTELLSNDCTDSDEIFVCVQGDLGMV